MPGERGLSGASPTGEETRIKASPNTISQHHVVDIESSFWYA